MFIGERPEYLKQYEQAALDWCNTIREQDGKPPLDELPLGRVHNPMECPCGKASGVYVSNLWYSRLLYEHYQKNPRALNSPFPPRDAPQDEVSLPDDVKEFVRYYDHGYYPHLVVKEED